ncbi:MAG: pacearchaeosortase [Candidatus Nanoarchaeia archaeon]
MRYETKLIIRVAIALAIFLIPINIFNIALQKPTMYISYAPIKLLGYDIKIEGETISIEGHYLRFISACTATSAYYLLAILLLLTKDIKPKKGIKMFVAGTLLILAMNIVRIDILLIVLVEKGINMFQALHLIFWEVVSSIYVAAVWIFLIKKFKVKNIPAISDIKELYKKSKIKIY